MKKEVSVFGWIGFMILSSIPFVNFVYWIILLASSNTNKTQKNFLWAQIVVILLVFVPFMLLFGAAFIAALSESIPA